nr:histidine kinase [Microbacterium halimionae]
MTTINVNVSAIFLLLLGVLIGINVGNRKRYLEALIGRSRQILIERNQHSRLAAAAERTRIAREMHDIVSHSLTVIVALSEGASVTNDRERAAEANRAIAGTARSALDEMRVMLGVLRDDDNNDIVPLVPDLASSLSELVDAARAAGFRVVLSTSGEPGGSSAARLAVLRIAREGLTNAMRYSHDPAQISLSVIYTDNEIEVSIENDGAHPSEPSQGSGYGLKGLGERLTFVGGTMTAGFVADSIWRLRARIPKEDTRA